jgi:hypothetical protein
MRRRLHIGLSRVMRSISSMTSAESGGRPCGRDLYAGPGAREHGELLPEHEDLHDEARVRAHGGDERAEQGRDDREHRWRP